MGFLGGLLSSRQDEIYERDAQRLLALCKSYGPKERGTLWAAGALAKAYLVLDHELDEARSIFLALDTLDNDKMPDKKERGELSAYLSRMIGLQQVCADSKDELDRLVGAGIPIWVTSVRAVLNPNVLPTAREIWATMGKGDMAYAQEVLDEAQRRLGEKPLAPVVAVARTHPTPKLFVPK